MLWITIHRDSCSPVDIAVDNFVDRAVRWVPSAGSGSSTRVWISASGATGSLRRGGSLTLFHVKRRQSREAGPEYGL